MRIMEYKNLEIVIGDLFELANNNEFDVIVQGNNCFNTQGAGIAVMFKKHFNSHLFPMELRGYGDTNKLGTIDYQYFKKQGDKQWLSIDLSVTPESEQIELLAVVNSYTQYHYARKKYGVCADYDAIRLVMRKLNSVFKGKRIGLPLIGGGLAGGDELTIKAIMDEELTDVKATLVIFNK